MWEKIQKLGKKSVLVIPIALLLRIIFVCIELIFKVKIQIYELPKRFGHLLVEPDIFLAKESGVTEKKLLFAVQSKDTSSKELQREWGRFFHRFPNSLLKCVLLYEMFIGEKRFTFDLVKSLPEELRVLGNTPQIAFRTFRDESSLLSINKHGKKIVFLVVRDINYDLEINIHTRGRHALYRNSHFESYLPAISHLISRNYFIVKGRTGSRINYDFQNENFFDLSVVRNPDEFDTIQFQLAKNAEFFLSTDTGALHLGTLFRKPIYRMNIASFGSGNTYSLFRLILLKRFVDSRTRQSLKLEDLIMRGILDFNHQEDFERGQVEVLDNSSQSILDFIEEVILDRTGDWKPNKNSAMISSQFQKLCEKYGYARHEGLLFPNSWSDENIEKLL